MNPMAEWRIPRAAYAHVPFCAHHCGYCDFAVVAGMDHVIDRYLDALAQEMSSLGEARPVSSVFLGGGTPTHLQPRQLERLLQIFRRWLPLEANYEFTVEANPATLDVAKIAVLADHGVNRVSLGAQSFQPPLLRFLERDHQPEDIARAVENVKRRIPHVSLDLIFGVPGQKLQDWNKDLEQALALGPEHLSTYGLTYEKGTPLWKQQQRGEVRPLDEEAELELYLHGLDTLERAGFEHYEISNHARPGCRSRHNQVYWANHAYFGFGVGAARYIDGRRELNTRDLQTYLKKVLAGESPVFQSEMLEPEPRARETLAVQLRRAEGVRRADFFEQTGFALDDLAGAALTRHAELGLIVDNGDSVSLTRRGKCVADALICELM